MTYFCVWLTYILAVLCFAPRLAHLQHRRYKPWRLPSVPRVSIWAATVVYNVALCLVWRFAALPIQYDALYLAAAYLPHAVWLCFSVKSTRLRLTARLWRLWVLSAALMAVPAVWITCNMRYIFVWGVCGALVAPVVYLSAALLYPLETARNRRFVRKAADRLLLSGVCTIGITGSAGKTTVKRLLTAALGPDAYCTQGNFNTPMGIALSVRDMPDNCRYFVAELGVGKPHDMRELLGVVRPSVGVVTCVLPQHTAHFDRVEDIRQEKCLLLDAAVWGLCHASVGYPAHATFGEGGDWWAENVRLSKTATGFDVCHRDERYRLEIPLVGRQTVDNALAAWAVARHLGVPAATIAERWRTVRGEPHRLEMRYTDRGVCVIDDSYNCNIKGATYALEYMQLWSGRKVVATSGIDESDPQLALNRRLGEMIAAVADVIVVVGDRYLAELRLGVGDAVPMYAVPTTAASAELYARLLHEGDVLLIMADYPM